MKKLPKVVRVIIYVFIGIIVLGVFSRLTQKGGSTSRPIDDKQAEIVDNTIPGANPVDIYLNLEKKGFKIDKQLGGSKGCFWNCEKSESGFDYNVTIASMAPGEIEQVKISVNINGSDPDKKIMAIKPFLKYVSTLPYEGSDTDKVTNWIEESFNIDKASIVIGKAKFSMHTSKFMRLIFIEKA